MGLKSHDNREYVLAMSALPWEGRAILLVDLDAFFASVEQLDHPGWRGKPVIVGGDSERRGVVSTASYEARRYGVHSAMPSATARKLCPDAIWTEGHYHRYREVSNTVMQILFDETPHVQQVSIDEAFMDITPTHVNREHPVVVAKRIQDRVAELGVTCSIGVGTTKSIAKLASDMDKPCGLTVVMPGSELNFIDPLPVRALSGIGASTERKLLDRGIRTLGDLYRAESSGIVDLLGKNGQMILNRVCGVEADPIEPDADVKSVSAETSFATDLVHRADIQAAIDTMAAKVGRRLRMKGLHAKTVALKVRYADRSVHSVQIQLPRHTDDEYFMQGYLHDMLDDLWSEGMALRLVGVATSDFEDDASTGQLSLFEDETADRGTSMHELLTAADQVKERFGEGALLFGRELRMKGTDTGTTSKNPADYKGAAPGQLDGKPER